MFINRDLRRIIFIVVLVHIGIFFSFGLIRKNSFFLRDNFQKNQKSQKIQKIAVNTFILEPQKTPIKNQEMVIPKKNIIVKKNKIQLKKEEGKKKKKTKNI